jgi:hypothetical protein
LGSGLKASAMVGFGALSWMKRCCISSTAELDRAGELLWSAAAWNQPAPAVAAKQPAR